jgi:hypothetical protein
MRLPWEAIRAKVIFVMEEFMFVKSFENQSGNTSVFLHALLESENVIEVNADDSFHDEVL